jgi:hypothetical protein
MIREDGGLKAIAIVTTANAAPNMGKYIYTAADAADIRKNA